MRGKRRPRKIKSLKCLCACVLSIDSVGDGGGTGEGAHLAGGKEGDGEKGRASHQRPSPSTKTAVAARPRRKKSQALCTFGTNYGATSEAVQADQVPRTHLYARKASSLRRKTCIGLGEARKNELARE